MSILFYNYHYLTKIQKNMTLIEKKTHFETNNDKLNNAPILSNIGKGVVSQEDDKLNKKIETLEKFDERIDEVIYNICFSCKRIAYDEFVKDNFDEDEIYSMVIKGSGNIYRYPYGNVWLHKSNIFFYDISNLNFIIENKLIPISFINFPHNDFGKEFNIKRSNGNIQKGSFGINSSLEISNTIGGVCAFIKFFDENYQAEMEKHTKFEELLKLNDISTFEIEIPNINYNDYNFPYNYKYLDESLIKTIIEYYNSKIKVFIGDFIENIIFKSISKEESKYIVNI